MKLRRVVASGFKTFASRAEVTFDRGVTAIVGPNGSGKSNLVDAVRWALGETNARELRGQRMDEVVYAGGSRRNRTNVAEVELVIDNEEGRLPLSDPEVSVTRRVVRGAHDTEYRINGERVRLRDLERLLGSTGLTQNGYAVVAQNDIDSIIEASPAQRRVLVEQAAGVRSLRAACEEAGARLDQADAVIRRMRDLLEDASPRLATLAAQRTAALEQRELTERLSHLRGSLAREEWRASRARLRQARRRLESARARLAAASEADAAFAERAASERGRLESARAERADAAMRLESARLEAERAAGEARRLVDRLRTAVLQRGQAVADLAAAAADVNDLERSLGTSGAGPDAEATAAAERLEAARERLAAADDAVDEAEAAAGQAAAALAHASDQLNAAAARRRELQVELDLVAAESARLAGEASALTEALPAIEHAAATAASEADHRAIRAAELEADRAAAQARLETSRARLHSAERAAASAIAAAREVATAAARLHGELSAFVGGDGPVARAVSEGRLVAQRLPELVHARQGRDATAVAAALEHNLGAWLVSDVDEASALFDAGGPREQLLARELDEPAPEQVPSPWRSALSSVDAPPEVLGVVARLLGGTWLAETIGDARSALRAGALAAVLPDGRVITEAGVRGGGAPGAVLDLAAAERAAREQAKAAARTETVAASDLEAAREQLAAAETELASMGDALRAALDLAASARADAMAAAAQLAAARERERDAQVASQAIDVRREAANAALAAADGQLQLASQTVEGARQRSSHAAHALGEQQEQRAEARQRLRDAEDVHVRLWRGVASPTQDETERLAESARARAGAAGLRVMAAEAEAFAALAMSRSSSLRGHRHAGAVAAAQAAIEAAAEPLAALERSLLALEGEHAEVAVSLARAEDEVAAADGEAAAAEAELARLADAVRDEGDDESGDWDPMAAERTEREIVRIERRIAAMGPVNALAPEEHDALGVRVAVLRRDHDDIAAASDDLRVLSRGLGTDLERRFDAVFGAVSFHFQQMFAELFPGGKAALRLESIAADEELPDGSITSGAERRPGVEILAQPPGKRLGPLRLLSGGERALTALATVLALQQVNPSPFYVFDEVDAALDDSNVLRFTRLLSRLAEQQQFIVVTHNHITMAAADVLWGVTIDGDGVSSVIGVRFDAAVHAQTVSPVALRRAETRVAG